jgi:hypothetical protein
MQDKVSTYRLAINPLKEFKYLGTTLTNKIQLTKNLRAE